MKKFLINFTALIATSIVLVALCICADLAQGQSLLRGWDYFLLSIVGSLIWVSCCWVSSAAVQRSLLPFGWCFPWLVALNGMFTVMLEYCTGQSPFTHIVDAVEFGLVLSIIGFLAGMVGSKTASALSASK